MSKGRTVCSLGQVKFRDEPASWHRMKTESPELYEKARLVILNDNQIMALYAVLRLEKERPGESFRIYDVWKVLKGETTAPMSRSAVQSTLANLVGREIIVDQIKDGMRADKIKGGEGLHYQYAVVNISPDIPEWLKKTWIECAKLRIEFLDKLYAISGSLLKGTKPGE